ncbi:MAG: tRNA-(ms[2]io[6]A)-hydroxylase [Kangiellaceae bacterium]|jgi:tRNA-(ms[2]io[6]A)-hydroxylase|nr:tRNA-(ms[2]io[6]A)-hydroxylase [Kangiellaceae bacterium]|tara:strand:- start:7833 stop:8438 length:606 start_codon:yes stop_codon:yes gene_type:complete
MDISEVKKFLANETPEQWIRNALANQDLLLIDHAHCEKKAASTAMKLMYRYVDNNTMLHKLSRLAREELRHFEQVLVIMEKRDIAYCHLSPARYAGKLHKHIRTYEPATLVDTLIIGAFIEARSCERFAKLAPFLDKELQDFYMSLLKSESRHFTDYLGLAQSFSSEPIDDRVESFRQVEAELISSPDTEFRFHSGPVMSD